jgi:hypothetical protein
MMIGQNDGDLGVGLLRRAEGWCGQNDEGRGG